MSGSVSGVINEVMKRGYTEPYGSAMKRTMTINESVVTVTYKAINGIIKISDAWVNR